MDGNYYSTVPDVDPKPTSGRSSPVDGNDTHDLPTDYENIEDFTGSRFAAQDNDGEISYAEINLSSAKYDAADTVGGDESYVEPSFNRYDDVRYEATNQDPPPGSDVLQLPESTESFQRTADSYPQEDAVLERQLDTD